MGAGYFGTRAADLTLTTGITHDMPCFFPYLRRPVFVIGFGYFPVAKNFL